MCIPSASDAVQTHLNVISRLLYRTWHRDVRWSTTIHPFAVDSLRKRNLLCRLVRAVRSTTLSSLRGLEHHRCPCRLRRPGPRSVVSSLFLEKIYSSTSPIASVTNLTSDAPLQRKNEKQSPQRRCFCLSKRRFFVPLRWRSRSVTCIVKDVPHSRFKATDSTGLARMLGTVFSSLAYPFIPISVGHTTLASGSLSEWLLAPFVLSYYRYKPLYFISSHSIDAESSSEASGNGLLSD